MVINILSLILDKAAADGSFSYHYHCEKTKLTHLSFTDDLSKRLPLLGSGSPLKFFVNLIHF